MSLFSQVSNSKCKKHFDTNFAETCTQSQNIVSTENFDKILQMHSSVLENSTTHFFNSQRQSRSFRPQSNSAVLYLRGKMKFPEVPGVNWTYRSGKNSRLCAMRVSRDDAEFVEAKNSDNTCVDKSERGFSSDARWRNKGGISCVKMRKVKVRATLSFGDRRGRGLFSKREFRSLQCVRSKPSLQCATFCRDGFHSSLFFPSRLIFSSWRECESSAIAWAFARNKKWRWLTISCFHLTSSVKD